MDKIKGIALVAVIAIMLVATMTLAPVYAKIQSIDTGSENPSGFAAPGQQPTASGGAQTQFTENQNPAGKAPPGQNKNFDTEN
ncbi:MAG: hypothetical protein WA941_07135 [Nitrososphaeraceae archaeon]